MEKLPHWVLTDKNPAFYDTESATAIEQTAKLYGAVNELIEDFNQLDEETTNHLSEQDQDIENQKNVVIPATIKDEIQNQIDNGTFEQAINEYAGDLESRLDNLLGSVTTGSTSMDAEVIDARVDVDGETHENAGNAIRKQVTNVMNLARSVAGFKRVNLVTETVNGYIDGATRLIVEHASYRTAIVYLEKGEEVYSTYSSHMGTNRKCWLYDEQTNKFVDGCENDSDSTTYNHFVIPKTGLWGFSYWYSTHVCVTKDVNNLSAPIGCDLPNDFIGSAPSVLQGKSISFNGDSICAGAGFTGGYGKIIADAHGMTYENLAVGGGTITAEQYATDGSPRHWVCRTIANMNPDADYLIVEGGVNDAALGATKGTLSSGYTATLDDTTFYGAFESMCKQLVTTFAGKKIGYIFVHKMTSNYHSSYQNNYYTAAKECCEKWGVPYLDLNIECPPLQYIDSLKNVYTANGDGWHPNEAGYRAYYVPKIKAWLETL